MNFSLILPEFIIHYHRRCGGGYLMWPSESVNPGFRLTGRSQNNQFHTADFCLRPVNISLLFPKFTIITRGKDLEMQKCGCQMQFALDSV